METPTLASAVQLDIHLSVHASRARTGIRSGEIHYVLFKFPGADGTVHALAILSIRSTAHLVCLIHSESPLRFEKLLDLTL